LFVYAHDTNFMFFTKDPYDWFRRFLDLNIDLFFDL